MALFLVLLLAAVVLGLVGALAKGLLWLLFIAILVFLLDLTIAGWARTRRRVSR